MRFHIRKLLELSTQQLWDEFDGEFTVVFDDQTELRTNHKDTIFSSYVWDLFRKHGADMVTARHHITSVLNGKLLNMSSISKLIGNVYWDLYDQCVASRSMESEQAMLFRETLARDVYQIMNHIYNELTHRLESYVISLRVEDFIESIRYPEIEEVLSRPTYTEDYVQEVYDTVDKVMIHDPELAIKENREPPKSAHNPLSKIVRSGVIDANQLKQCIGLRGFITDIDSHQFPIPIVRNLTNGIISFYDSFIESRSAAKSLAFSQTPLQDSEYFNRKTQLLANVIKHLVHEDCGSKHYLDWRVKEEDFEQLLGKKYLKEDGSLGTIHQGDRDLIGKSLQLRSALTCQTENPYGVCSTCLGDLSLYVFRDTNIGQLMSSDMNGIVSQAVLSVKHLDGSSVIDGVKLDDESKKYFRITRTGDGYLLAPHLAGNSVKLVIDPEQAPGLVDINEVKSVDDLSVTRTTTLTELGIELLEKGWVGRVQLKVGMVRRPASFTHDFLDYVRKTGWTTDDNGMYLIDLSGWDVKRVLMTVPHRHFNMGDHSAEISKVLEGNVMAADRRNREITPRAFIIDLFDLVNSRLKINLAVLEIIAYSIMIVDADPLVKDYSLPKPWTRQGLGVYNQVISRRSLGTAMAYQDHRGVLTNPISFNLTNRLDSPMDVFLDPKGVSEYMYGLNHPKT